MVHHETTTGLLNPGKAIAEVVDGLNRVFILDAVSALAGEISILPVQKSIWWPVQQESAFRDFPGVSFVLVRKGFLERMRAYPKRSWYLHLTHYVDDQGRATVPFTPAVQVYYAFDEALNELLEEGVAKRIQRYKKMAQLIRERMAKIGVKPVLQPDRQSNSITAYYLPEGLAYQTLHDRLRALGYVIYAGQGNLETQDFSHCQYGRLDRSAIYRVSRCL